MLASWTDFVNSCSFNVSHVSSQSTTTYTLPLTSQCEGEGLPSMVLGENGTAFATHGSNLISFDVNSGSVAWSYQPPTGDTFTVITTTAGNGLVGKITDQNSVDTAVRIDSTGVAVDDSWTGSNINYWADDVWPGVSPITGTVVAFSASPVQFSTADFLAPMEFGTNQAAQDLQVTNASNSGPNQAVIGGVFSKIQTALNADASSQSPTCSNWLQGSGVTGSVFIQNLLVGSGNPSNPINNFGHGSFNTLETAAVTGGRNKDETLIGVPANFAITVNDVGAFFNSGDGQGHTFSVGRRHYPGGSLRAQAAILIHELGHAMPVVGFQPDAGVPKARKANDKLVDINCRKLIEGLQ